MFSCFQQSAFHWNVKNLLSLTVTELWGKVLHFGISATVHNCGATQKFGVFDHKKKFLTPSFHHLLQNSPLGRVYSDPSMFPMISCIPGSSQM